MRRQPSISTAKKEKGEIKMKIQSISGLLLAALLLTSAVGIAFADIVVAPYENANAIWVDNPPFVFNTATTSIGYEFNITVAMNITSAEEVYAWQVAMLYPEIGFGGFLKCLAAGPTAPPTSEFLTGHTTTGFALTLDPGLLGHQGLLAEEGLESTDFRVGWAATLFWAEFEIMAAPPAGHTLSGKFDVTTYAAPSGKTWWEDAVTYSYWGLGTDVNGYNLTTYDCPITYTWSAPTTLPHMGIDGAGSVGTPLVFGPYLPTAVGDTFTADVSVKNIDPAWYLSNLTFTLTWNSTVIDVLGGIAGTNFSLASGWSVITNTMSAGVWNFVANFTGTAPPLVGGTNIVPIANLTFTVLIQQHAPPYPVGYADTSTLIFSGVAFYASFGPITAATPDEGDVEVLALVTLKLPWLQVTPATQIVGPAPSIGTIIEVDVEVENLTSHWYTSAIQFRLQYDNTVLTLVNVTEGPFMTNSIWDEYGTFFTSVNLIGGDLVYPYTHIEVLDLLYPNTTTGIYDQAVLPNTVESAPVNPVVAKFFFTVEAQNCFGGANITTALNILPFWPTTDHDFIDINGNYISDLPGVNGTVTIEPIATQSQTIDLFGGAVNDGYGNLVPYIPPYTPYYNEFGTAPYLAFPAPYGGQGPNQPMDIVFPQSLVYLYAYVTYNYWPVEYKDVGFEVDGPFYHVTSADNGGLLYNSTGGLVVNASIPAEAYVPEEGQTFYNATGAPFVVLTLVNAYQVWAKFSSETDVNGVASYTYRMPWPDNPDLYTGVWRVTATSTVADQQISDTMMFYYQRVVYITKVTTDYSSYYHNSFVQVTVNYQTHSIEMYPALFSVVITDNLGVPFGMALYNTEVGGTVFCTWLQSSFTVSIFIPKWAYAGNAEVHVSVFDKDPTLGGEPWQSEYLPDPIINIYPYTTPLAVSTDQDAYSPITWSISGMAPVTTQPINALAVGGFPYLVGYVQEYNYTWTVINALTMVSTLVKTDNLVSTSMYGFSPAVWGTGSWFVKVTATDQNGQTASDEVLFIVTA
jgi:hypothetical protein